MPRQVLAVLRLQRVNALTPRQSRIELALHVRVRYLLLCFGFGQLVQVDDCWINKVAHRTL